MENSIDKIREAEKASHIEIYSTAKLFESGSWLQKPVKTVLDILPLFEDYTELSVLDLGSGVGRNCIPVAQKFSDISSSIDCVDILDFAIEELKNNSRKYDVEKSINGVVSSIDDFDIEENHYDFIMAISALEHINSEKAFGIKLKEIQNGTNEKGVVCLIINSEVKEKNKETGKALVPQFEVNLKTSALVEMLENIFKGWDVLKKTVVSQNYDIPRENCIAALSTNVVTFVARKG